MAPKRATVVSKPAAAAAPSVTHQPPQPPGPLLCRSSVALKWDGPVSPATRASVCGCLWSLAESPDACALVTGRLAAHRLAVLVTWALADKDGGRADGGKKPGKKKKGGALSLDPAREALLTAAVGCLKLLAAACNADAFRVAATPGALAGVVRLGEEAKGSLLRRSARVGGLEQAATSHAPIFARLVYQCSC